MALEVLSLLCTFENSSTCVTASFDSDSFPESRIAKRSIRHFAKSTYSISATLLPSYESNLTCDFVS